jgi:hypothetical protein
MRMWMPEVPLIQRKGEASELHHRNLCRLLLAVGKSDHLLLALVFDKWREADGSAARRRLCDQLGLVWERMSEIGQVTGPEPRVFA